MPARTMFDKIWDEHVVAARGDGIDLLHVDRTLMHDIGGGELLEGIAKRGLAVRHPELTFATADHVVESRPGRTGGIAIWADELIDSLRTHTRAAGVRLFDVNDAQQGIVHVIGPELGVTLPGATLVCGDSHTCTHGALGALAWGVGITELEHVLVTQTIVQKRPRTMRVRFEGELPAGISAKDMALALLAKIGAAGAVGYAIEYAGPVVRALDMEARMTLCNLSIELGAKVGMIAPDETTFAWLASRPYAPRGDAWTRAVAHWRTLPSHPDARFGTEITVDCSTLVPHITWGTSPEQTIRIDGTVPDPAAQPDAARRQAVADALAYMGLQPNEPIVGTRVDRVFIGSCTNGRLSDLRAAAAVLRGRRVAPHVRAWVVPGSMQVKHAAESEGLHHAFLDAGFEWREPGCSLCVGANGEYVEPRARCVSTSNRNFVGRQGPLARTHLASPAMAAAAAVAGHIVDARSL